MKLQTEDILFPVSEVLNLKSYYLSSYFHNDSLSLIYGYNYKSHALEIGRITEEYYDERYEAISKELKEPFCNRAFYTNSGLYLDL